MISYVEGKQLAKEYLTNIGFSLNAQEILNDPDNHLWQEEFINNEDFKKHNQGIVRQLEAKNYWAVQFYPKDQKNIKGGGAVVIVENDTGKVILHFCQK